MLNRTIPNPEYPHLLEKYPPGWNSCVLVSALTLKRLCRWALGGSWVVISRVTSRVTILITQYGGLISPFRTAHEPPSKEAREARSRFPDRTLSSRMDGTRNPGGACWVIATLTRLNFGHVRRRHPRRGS